MFQCQQFRTTILQPALNLIGLYSPDAEELLVATMAQETLGGTYLTQVNGPALGIYQMEKENYDKLWQVNISQDPALARLILNGCQYIQRPPAEHMVWNLYLATMMARVYYHKINKPLPKANSLQDIWLYYKEWWNSSKGAATQDEFYANYHRFIGVSNEKVSQERGKKSTKRKWKRWNTSTKPRKRRNNMIPAIIVIIAAVIGLGSVYLFHEPKDNPIEQIAEEVIEKETGVKIDLTPNPPPVVPSANKTST